MWTKEWLTKIWTEDCIAKIMWIYKMWREDCNAKIIEIQEMWTENGILYGLLKPFRL